LDKRVTDNKTREFGKYGGCDERNVDKSFDGENGIIGTPYQLYVEIISGFFGGIL
jgi:hypothetical protein